MEHQMKIMELETAGRVKQMQEKFKVSDDKRKKLHNMVRGRPFSSCFHLF
jgi:hypothetical protein